MDIIIVHIASFISDKKIEAFYSFIAWPTWILDVIAAKYSCKHTVTVSMQTDLRPSKKICVFTVTCPKKISRVGRLTLLLFIFFTIGKTGNSCSRNFIFDISGKPSFVEAVLWWVTQFFYLLCSQFPQKASGWINKTLLVIKQQNCYPNSV